MSRTWLRMGLLGAALLVGSQTLPASAAPLPALDRNVFKAANAAETVKWKCGPWNCYWKPGYAGWAPPKARVWGPAACGQLLLEAELGGLGAYLPLSGLPADAVNRSRPALPVGSAGLVSAQASLGLERISR